MVKVWDPLVRLFHWGLVLSFATAWLSAGHAKTLHHWAGYVAAALLAIRVAWGLVGTRYARFTQFVRGPGAALSYLRDIAGGDERRFVGHNPAGGAMVVVLIAGVALQVLTGWLATTDMFFGVDWVEQAHQLLSKLLLGLVVLHLLGVAIASLRHRENLPGAMLTGRKRPRHGARMAPRTHLPAKVTRR